MSGPGRPGANGATRCVLILALGGEGGGMLAQWLVSAAQQCGYPVQSTSIPGVAQRTGATSYYLECLPRAQAADAPQPVFCLAPMAGELDLLVSTELLETARALERGLADPQRTCLISSSARVLTVAEKMPMADGRRDADALARAVAALHPGVVLFDMQAAARAADTVVSAVMFGAIVASGVLALPRDVCEALIRRSGRGAQASLAGFAAGFGRIAAMSGDAPAGEGSTQIDEDRDIDVLGTPLPAPVGRLAAHGARRIAEFQDEALARDYVARVARHVALERAGGGAPGYRVSTEAARRLALWAAYEDLIRVAELKSSAERFERIRADVGAREDEPIVVRDFLRPGVAEIADLLPTRLAHALRRALGARSFGAGFRLPTSRPLGLAAMRVLASLRPLRRHGSRFAREQSLIARWDRALCAALGSDADLALQIASLPRLIRGYGDTHARGLSRFVQILEALVESGAGTARERARAIAAATRAAEADPEGRALASALGLTPAEPRAQPIRFIRRER